MNQHLLRGGGRSRVAWTKLITLALLGASFVGTLPFARAAEALEDAAAPAPEHRLHPPVIPRPLPPIPSELRPPQFRMPLPFKDAFRDGYVLVLWNTSYDEARLKAMLDRIGESGARHLTLPIFGCQSDLKSSDVGSCDSRESREFVLRLVRLAQEKGFLVSLLPIVITKNWEWRGLFEPSDVDAWFAAYTAWIRGIATEVRKYGMQELVVGTEFSRLYRYESHWRLVIQEVRKEFAGPVVLTANWGDLDHQFWDAVDAIGISSYYPLSAKDRPGQSELDRAWGKLKKQLLEVAQKWQRPLHLTEIGYPSAPGAARQPWNVPGNEAVPDPDLQARCFSAFTKAWKNERSLVRFNVWATSDPDDAAYPLSFDPLGKPAQQVLASFFRLREGRR